MEERIVYRNHVGRSLSYMVIGVLLLPLVMIKRLVGAIIFFAGITVFFVGLGSLLRRKPQIVLDKDGIYIGFKEKVKLPWSKVTAAVVKKEDVDEGIRQVWMLKVKAKSKSGGREKYKVVNVNVEMLKVDGIKLQEEINHFRGRKVVEDSEFV
jgi:hypothetical protein